jgi:hypothetical protein
MSVKPCSQSVYENLNQDGRRLDSVTMSSQGSHKFRPPLDAGEVGAALNMSKVFIRKLAQWTEIRESLSISTHKTAGGKQIMT